MTFMAEKKGIDLFPRLVERDQARVDKIEEQKKRLLEPKKLEELQNKWWKTVVQLYKEAQVIKIKLKRGTLRAGYSNFETRWTPQEDEI